MKYSRIACAKHSRFVLRHIYCICSTYHRPTLAAWRYRLPRLILSPRRYVLTWLLVAGVKLDVASLPQKFVMTSQTMLSVMRNDAGVTLAYAVIARHAISADVICAASLVTELHYNTRRHVMSRVIETRNIVSCLVIYWLPFQQKDIVPDHCFGLAVHAGPYSGLSFWLMLCYLGCSGSLFTRLYARWSLMTQCHNEDD